MNKVVAFIPARIGSSRLPRKHFRKIGDRCLLDWVIKRAKDCPLIDEVVVCFPQKEEGYRDFIAYCDSRAVSGFNFSGDIIDVVGRLTAASVEYSADISLLLSGDCPLLCEMRLETLLNGLLTNPDCRMTRFKDRDGIPHIMQGYRVDRSDLWDEANNVSFSEYDREHQFPILNFDRKETPDKRPLLLEACDEDYSIIGDISVNTGDDVAHMNFIYETLSAKGLKFNLSNARDLIYSCTPANQEI